MEKSAANDLKSMPATAVADFEGSGSIKEYALNRKTRLEQTVTQKDEDILFKGVEALQIADRSPLAVPA